MRGHGVVERVEQLGLKVRLHSGRLQYAETVPGAKAKHQRTVVALSPQLTRELAERDGCGPRIDAHGNLVIPLNAPLRYRWWEDGGQRINETLAELRVSLDVWVRYTEEPYPLDLNSRKEFSNE